MLRGHLDGFIKKIVEGNTFFLGEEKAKTSKNGHLEVGTNGHSLTPTLSDGTKESN